MERMELCCNFALLYLFGQALNLDFYRRKLGN